MTLCPAFCGHKLCKMTKRASNVIRSRINMYLGLVLGQYGTRKKVGITERANSVEEDKEYQVCNNYKKKLIKAAQPF